MPDREKVIKGLECCAAMSGDECNKCPYGDECIDTDLLYGIPHLASDALALLKEQEAVEPIINKREFAFPNGTFGDVSMAFCGNCRKGIDIRIHSSDGYNYCPYCGRPVKWDDL